MQLIYIYLFILFSNIGLIFLIIYVLIMYLLIL